MKAGRHKLLARLAREAFTASLPVLTGYSTMGFASGVLLALKCGVASPALWAVATSALFVSGPIQFLLVNWVCQSTGYLDVALVVVGLNLRYSLYGLSLLERFAAMPLAARLYAIGTVTDETYALQSQCRYPPGRTGTVYCVMLAFFDHMYWIGGVTAGALAGKALAGDAGNGFDAKGIDFAMTALFLVILLDQCRDGRGRRSAAVGAVCAAAAAVAMHFCFGGRDMLLPAMGAMLAALLALRGRIEGAQEDAR